MIANDCEYEATKGVFDEGFLNLKETNMNNVLTFARVCRKLEITEEQKTIIMEDLAIDSDDMIVDFAERL